jgi:hypothetical protein
MALASPRLANEAIAIAIVVAKGTRKKGTTTQEIDREQMSRCMTRPPEKLIQPSNSGDTTAFLGGHSGFSRGTRRLFNGLVRPGAVYTQLWPPGYSASAAVRRDRNTKSRHRGSVGRPQAARLAVCSAASA